MLTLAKNGSDRSRGRRRFQRRCRRRCWMCRFSDNLDDGAELETATAGAEEEKEEEEAAAVATAVHHVHGGSQGKST